MGKAPVDDDPFESLEMTATNVVVHTKPDRRTQSRTMDAAGAILRLAEIDDELSRRGIDPLMAEQETLKKQLKELMLEDGVVEIFEEVSGWEAVLQERSSEQWDVEALKAILKPTARKRYIVVQESVDTAAVKAGVKNGDLSRAELEYKGAVKRVPGSVALYVRRRK